MYDGGFAFFDTCAHLVLTLSLYDAYLVKLDANGNMLWNKTYDGGNNDFGNEIIQTSDGGFALICTTYSVGDGNATVQLIKTDAAGNAQWNKTYTGTVGDEVSLFTGAYGHAIAQTSDGGYIIGANDNQIALNGYYVYDKVYLIKTDSSGNVQWAKSMLGANITGYNGLKIVQARDGGFVFSVPRNLKNHLVIS
jgi:hypothetical protein